VRVVRPSLTLPALTAREQAGNQSRLLLRAGVLGVVLMSAGVTMGMTGVAPDRITVPSWLDPARNRLMFQIFVIVMILSTIWVYLRFF
jgi:hypothetical protein